MPDIYMHTRLVQDILKDHDNLDETLLLIGAQGADPFYYGKYPLSRSLGDDMHDHHITKLFTLMTNYVKAHYTKELYSFYLGFVLHATLDQHIHPYVYHHVGVYDKRDASTHHMRGLHMRFERSMDALLIAEDTEEKATKYPLKNALPLKLLPKSVLSMMDHLVYEVFGIAQGGLYYQNGYKRMRWLITHIMKDTTGLKTLLYKGFDLFNKQQDYFYQDFTFHKLPKEPFDYLNRNHTPWRHPVTNKPSYKSIDDLYLDALWESDTLIKKIAAYIHKNIPMNFYDVFKNTSLNTGIEASVEGKIQYLNIYTQK